MQMIDTANTMVNFLSDFMSDFPLFMFSSPGHHSGSSGATDSKLYQLIGPNTINNPNNIDLQL